MGCLDVAACGATHTGSCTFKGNGQADTCRGGASAATLAMSFYTNRFKGGTQTGIVGSGEGLAWVVSEL